MKPAVIEPGLTLLVGLGNPGPKYDQTRHNAGFWFLDRVAERFAASFRNQGKFQGHVAEALHRGRKIFLLKPMTFMNLSGRSASALARFYNIPVEQILVAHDELDLPPGGVKLKCGGGHAGHNGLRDMAQLGSADFWRLRIGIGRPGQNKNGVVDYVLQNPSKDDRILIDTAIDASLDVLDLLLDGQMEKAMHQLHSK